MFQGKTFLVAAILFGQLTVLGQSLSGPVDFFYAPKQDAHQPVIAAINSAQKTVKMVMYHLSDPAEAVALENAASNRGVDVRIIFDKGEWKNPNDAQLVKNLQSAGVKVVQASSAFRITHEKAMVIDDSRAMISTMNQIKTFMQMFDMGVFTTDQGVIAEWLSVFETDWQNASNSGQETPALSSANLIWSPINSTDRLVKFIGEARTNIELTVENLSDTNIQNALIDAAGRGVSIRTLVPKCDAVTPSSFNYPSTTALRHAKVDARMMPGPANTDIPYIHGKSIVVDRNRVFLGSENFSLSSLTLSREVGIIMDNSNVASDIEGLFNDLWTKAVLPPTDPTYKCSAFDVSTPPNAGVTAAGFVLSKFMIQPSQH